MKLCTRNEWGLIFIITSVALLFANPIIFQLHGLWPGANDSERSALSTITYGPMVATWFFSLFIFILGVFIRTWRPWNSISYRRGVMLSLIGTLAVSFVFISLHLVLSGRSVLVFETLKANTIIRANELSRYLPESLDGEIRYTTDTGTLYEPLLREAGVDKYTIFDSWGRYFIIKKRGNNIQIISDGKERAKFYSNHTDDIVVSINYPVIQK